MLLKFSNFEDKWQYRNVYWLYFELVYNLTLLPEEHLKAKFEYRIMNVREWDSYSGYLIYETVYLGFEASMFFIDKNKKENYIFRSYYEFPEQL
jgi:hypothetical protein